MPWSEKLLAERLVAGSMDGVLAYDLEFRYILWNPAMEHITGFSKEDVLGKCALEVFPFLRDSGEEHYIRQAMEGKTVVATDRPYVIPSTGRQGYFEGHYFPLWSEADEIVGAVAIIRDITQRRQLEEQLRRREQHFQSLIENTSDIISIMGPTGTIVYVSSSVERILGYKPAELIGGNAFDFIDPSDRGRVEGIFGLESEMSGLKAPVEFRVKHKTDGGWRVIEAVGNNLLADPSVGDVVVTLRDITERKRAEEAIEESRDFYLQLLEDFPTLIWRSGLDGKCDYFNKKWLAFTGRSFEEEFGDGWAEGVHPEDLARCLATYQEAFQARRPFEMVYRLRRYDGEYRWILDSGQPFTDVEGKFAGYVGCCYDITERKRWEEAVRRYQLLSENARDIVLFVHFDGRIIEANRAAEDAYGYSREALLSLRLADLRTPEARHSLAEHMRQARERGALYETTHLRKDGSAFPVEVSSRAAKVDGESVVLSIVRDISERKRLEEQLTQAQKMEAVGRLAGGLAHDFNNLMTVVTGYCDLLVNRLGEENPARSDIHEIRKAGERAAKLTQQLLAFSRRQILQPEVVDLNAVVAETEAMLRRLIGEDIRLSTVLNPEAGYVRADRGQIGQVIMNLAVNARDAMPQGGELTIEVGNTQLDEAYARRQVGLEPGAYVVLSITDTGTGMDAATRARIFEPFFTTKEPGKGTGLGLPMVYGIVKQSGGHVSCYSELGHGTTFKIYLPLVEEGPRADAGQPAPETASAGNETVLLVEDEDQLRVLARQILEQEGYSVLEAGGGAEALSLCRAHPGPIHLLLTDIVMPDMNGHELALRLTEIRSETRVLYVSGYTENAVSHHGMLDPGAYFLAKPFSPEKLAGKVREVLGNPKRR